MPVNNSNDYTTHGMTEREMKKRIKSHRQMAMKAAEKSVTYALPSEFLSESFRTWMKDNPNSPWIKKGGLQDIQKQAETSINAMDRANKRLNTAHKIQNALKLKQQLKKITGS